MMFSEDFASCFTKIGPYKRDESMLVLLKTLDMEREAVKQDGLMYRHFGAVEIAERRVNHHIRYMSDKENWSVY